MVELSKKQLNIFHKPVFILGLPRSGTSLVGGILAHCGLWMGSTFAGDKNNPKGYFEHIGLRDFVNKPMLNQITGDPSGVLNLPSIEAVKEKAFDNLGQVVFENLVKDQYGFNQPWGFKDAKLSITWPLWARPFPKARWLIVERNVDDFISSCRRTHFMAHHSDDPAFWQAMADHYGMLLDGLRAEHDTYTVSAEQVMQGDLTQVKEAVKWAGLKWRKNPVETFIDRDLWKRKSYD